MMQQGEIVDADFIELRQALAANPPIITEIHSPEDLVRAIQAHRVRETEKQSLTNDDSQILFSRERAWDGLGEPHTERRIDLAERETIDIAPLRMEIAQVDQAQTTNDIEEKTQASVILYKGKVYSGERHFTALNAIAEEHKTTPEAIMDEFDDPLEMVNNYVTNKGKVIDREQMYQLGWASGTKSNYIVQEAQAINQRAHEQRIFSSGTPAEKKLITPAMAKEKMEWVELFSDDAVISAMIQSYHGRKIPDELNSYIEAFRARYPKQLQNLIDMASCRNDQEKAKEYRAHESIVLDALNPKYNDDALGQSLKTETAQTDLRNGHNGTELKSNEKSAEELAILNEINDAFSINDREYKDWKNGGMTQEEYTRRWHVHYQRHDDFVKRLINLAEQRGDQEAITEYKNLPSRFKCPGNCHAQGLPEGSLGNCDPTKEAQEDPNHIHDKTQAANQETREQHDQSRRDGIFTYNGRQRQPQPKSNTSAPVAERDRLDNNEPIVLSITPEEKNLFGNAMSDKATYSNRYNTPGGMDGEAYWTRQSDQFAQLITMAEKRNDTAAAAYYGEEMTFAKLESKCPGGCLEQGLPEGSLGHCDPVQEQQTKQKQAQPVPNEQTNRQQEQVKRDNVFTYNGQQRQPRPTSNTLAPVAERDRLADITDMPLDPKGDHNRRAPQAELRLYEEAVLAQTSQVGKDDNQGGHTRNQRKLVNELAALAKQRNDPKAAEDYKRQFGIDTEQIPTNTNIGLRPQQNAQRELVKKLLEADERLSIDERNYKYMEAKASAQTQAIVACKVNGQVYSNPNVQCHFDILPQLPRGANTVEDGWLLKDGRFATRMEMAQAYREGREPNPASEKPVQLDSETRSKIRDEIEAQCVPPEQEKSYRRKLIREELQQQTQRQEQTLQNEKPDTIAQYENHIPGEKWIDPITGRWEPFPCTRWTLPGSHNWTDAELASRPIDASQMNPRELERALKRRGQPQVSTTQNAPQQSLENKPEPIPEIKTEQRWAAGYVGTSRWAEGNTRSEAVSNLQGEESSPYVQQRCLGDCAAQNLPESSLGHCAPQEQSQRSVHVQRHRHKP
jgi:hypothetical protein